jgi:hypothetical protein
VAGSRAGQPADHDESDVTQWGTVFGDEVLAAAILDRQLRHSHTLMIYGETYRLKHKKEAGFFAAAVQRGRSELRTDA